MPPPPPRHRLALPTVQLRSRATVDRLVVAAERVLAQRGLEATTVAAVAREARMSVGVVYKRFPDKDALLRVVYERFVQQAGADNVRLLSAANWRESSLPDVIASIVARAVDQQFEQRQLLRALAAFGESHPNPGFRRRAEALREQTFAAFKALLLRRNAERRHPHPVQAIEFAFLVLRLVLRGIVLETDDGGRGPLRSKDRLRRELTAMLQRYLGLAEDKARLGLNRWR